MSNAPLSYTQNPVLWGRIYAFNEYCATYAHVSHWPEALNPSFLKRLLDGPKSCRLLSLFLLEKVNAAHTYMDDFSSEVFQLALLEAPILQSLFLYAGAAVFHERLARVLSKDKRKVLENQIGKAIYQFALRKAPLTLGKKPPYLFFDSPTEDLYEDILAASKRLFEGALKKAPYGLKARLMLKLPAALVWDWETPVDESTQTLCWQFLKRLLLKEVAPDTLLFS